MLRQGGVVLLVFGLGYRPGQPIRDGQPWCAGRLVGYLGGPVRTGGVSLGSLDQVAAVAEAPVATDRAPAAAMTMALDRLSRIFPCRDNGTFRWLASCDVFHPRSQLPPCR
jgi:hypothetical protein